MRFENLIRIIHQTHERTAGYALQQINRSLTTRNWIIGCYIVEYEQNGEDRAQYGRMLIPSLADNLKSAGLKGVSETQLKLFRTFFLTYPQIRQMVSDQLLPSVYQLTTIRQTLSGEFKKQPLPATNETSEQDPVETLTNLINPDILLSRLSFSHFIELLKAETPIKRAFYEAETIKNNWSVRELKRAMETLLFERTGVSIDKQSVIAKIKDSVPAVSADIIKNPYILEFLGLEEKPEYTESDLEGAIIEHLQKFLMEMGRGFCFEARQKRISFDNRHYAIDLVFYHRLLKCHVLVDLKLGEFSHADAGQMNMYLNYFKENEMVSGDNPPVGIILCAQKNDSLAKYATGGLAHEIFVGKYMLQLPSIEELKQLINADIRSLQ